VRRKVVSDCWRSLSISVQVRLPNNDDVDVGFIKCEEEEDEMGSSVVDDGRSSGVGIGC
jgi:hypothetical protein